MAFPKDLRQKMINMMYLVLMAMLAINIDPAALQGYKTINEGMKFSYDAFESTNEGRVNAIAALADKEKKPNQLKIDSLAKILSGVSSGLNTKIDGLITDIRAEASGTGEYSADSKDPADRIMITNDIDNGAASKLKTDIEDLLSQYNSIVNASPLPDSIKTELLSSFALQSPSDDTAREDEDNKDGDGWAKWTFEGKPAIAIEAILNQIKNDAKATEGQILERFQAEMNADKIDIPYDTYNLALVPSSTYMAEGDPFKAKLSVGQSSSKAQGLVRIFVNGSERPVNSDGFADFQVTSGVGEHTVNAYALVTNPQTGVQERVDLAEPLKYRVAKPSATVSADKMNVFYIGLENPVSVSATGMDDAVATCSGCTSFNRNSTGGYDANVQGLAPNSKVKVNVTSGGRNVSSSEFRVLKVPDPQVLIGNVPPGNSISSSSLAAQGILRAKLDNFPYNATFKVVSFQLAMVSQQGTVSATSSNGSITPQMKDYFRRAGPGWAVVFRNIKVQGPGGVRSVPPVTYITK